MPVPPAWMYSPMSKADADEILLSNANEDGEFFVRQREPQSRDFVMTLLFQGKATHHLMRKDESGVWTINGKKYVEEIDLVKVWLLQFWSIAE